MSFSRESRNRNLTAPSPYPSSSRSLPPGLSIIGGIVLVAACCFCGLVGGGAFKFVSGGGSPLSFGGPSPTPTVDKKAPVPLNTKALADNGLELTVTEVQRPLKVQGSTQLPADQQFILVSIHLRNTKRVGAPIQVTPDDFKATGDGGLTYDANPAIVTIPQELAQASLAPGASLDGELIFQIASNDSGMKMTWKVGTSSRIFSLEKQQ